MLSKWLPARRKDYDLSQPASPTSSLEFTPLRVMTASPPPEAPEHVYAPVMHGRRAPTVEERVRAGKETTAVHLSLLSRTLSAGRPMVRKVAA